MAQKAEELKQKLTQQQPASIVISITESDEVQVGDKFSAAYQTEKHTTSTKVADAKSPKTPISHSIVLNGDSVQLTQALVPHTERSILASNAAAATAFQKVNQAYKTNNRHKVQLSNGDLTVVESLGTTQENQTAAFASPMLLRGSNVSINSPSAQVDSAKHSPSKQKINQLQQQKQHSSDNNLLISLLPSDGGLQTKSKQDKEMIVEQNMADESEEAMTDENVEDDAEYELGSEFSSENDMEMLLSKDRSNSNFVTSGSDFNRQRSLQKRHTKIPEPPLPIYQGDIRGYEPAGPEQQRKSIYRMLTYKKPQNRQEELVRHNSQNDDTKTAKSANGDTKNNKAEQENETAEAGEEVDQKDCKHLKVRRHKCERCDLEVPHYGSVFDTGTIKTFIKVVYVDESKKQSATMDTTKPTPSSAQQTIDSDDGAGHQQHNRPSAMQDAYNDVPNSVVNSSSIRDFRSSSNYQPMANYRTIYESYTPENTHLMREYMLHVIIRQVRYMLKHRLISKVTHKKFHLLPSMEPPKLQSKELRQFLSQHKRDMRTQDPELLKFDSTIESGNLERVEAQPISQKYVEMQRANGQPVIQKYNLFCKVDTNTKGHQQWFYFKVKNTKLDTRYQMSICNFTKPFSLFKQGMQIQMLSKKHQAAHVKGLEAEIEEYDAALAQNPDKVPTLSHEAKRLKETGLVTEQWQAAGKNIEYIKSKMERAGWNVPGPLNLDEEEEPNVDQDDLNIQLIDDNGASKVQQNSPQQEANGQFFRKRYFYQMNFEIEFPYEDDTVYLAYSQPYPYTKIIAHMFDIESKLSTLPRFKSQNLTEDIKKGFKRKIIRNSITYERSLLCTTICGLPVPNISITANKSSSGPSVNPLRRKVIFVTARVHPGETNASTVFEGFLNSLVEQVEYSPVLGNFIVRMVPCMNPDGVVCGNYRSSLAGVDLNRQWILPSKELHPEVYYTKALMQHITKVENKKILIYCDIHCHSKKRNSFLYGCNTAGEGAPFSTWTQVRLLPRLLARRSEYISLPSCRFGVETCKLGTARVVVWKEFRVMNSFTLENSFYGYDYGSETRVYTQDHYREIGAGLEKTLNDYRVCLAQIQVELIDSKGWLKPSKLKEISGIPAAEVIAKEMKEDKIRKKKEEYIRKYTSRMNKERDNKGYSFAPLPQNQNVTGSSMESLRQSAQNNTLSRRHQSPQHSSAFQVHKSYEDQSQFASGMAVRKQMQHQLHKKALPSSQTRVKVSDNASQRHSMNAGNNIYKESNSMMSQSHEFSESEHFKGKLATFGAIHSENKVDESERGANQRKVVKKKSTARKLVSQEWSGSNQQSMANPMTNKFLQQARDSTYTLLNGDDEMNSSSNQVKGSSANQNTGALKKKHSSMLVKNAPQQYSHQQQQQQQPQMDNVGSQGYSSEPEGIDERLIAEQNMTAHWGDNLDEKISAADASISMNQTKFEDWRQLFGEEELQRAYQLSIIQNSSGNQDAEEQSEHFKVFEASNYPMTGGDQLKVLQVATHDMANMKLGKHVEDQEALSSNDASDGSASDDNLREVELYKKVYMKKTTTTEKKMRQTMRAQKNFIQEVRILINKKDILFEMDDKSKFDNRNQAKAADSKAMIRSAYEQFKVPSTAIGLNHSGLHLTGVQIENPNKEPYKTPQVAKELNARRTSSVKKEKSEAPGVTRFKKQLKKSDIKLQRDLRSDQKPGPATEESTRELVPFTRLDLEEGKKPIKVPTKFQQQKFQFVGNQSIESLEQDHSQNEFSAERLAHQSLLNKDLLMVGSLDFHSGQEEYLGGLLTSNRVNLQKFDSNKKEPVAGMSVGSGKKEDCESPLFKVDETNQYNVKMHLTSSDKSALTNDEAAPTVATNQLAMAMPYQNHSQFRLKSSQVDSPQSAHQTAALANKRRSHKEYSLQVKSSQDDGQNIIDMQISLYQKLQQQMEFDRQNANELSPANPFKLEMVNGKNDSHERVSLGISSFKLQTPGIKTGAETLSRPKLSQVQLAQNGNIIKKGQKAALVNGRRLGVGRSIPPQQPIGSASNALEEIREAKELHFRSSRSKISSRRSIERIQDDLKGVPVSTKDYIRRKPNTQSNMQNLPSKSTAGIGVPSVTVVPIAAQVKQPYEDQNSHNQAQNESSKLATDRRLIKQKLFNYNRRGTLQRRDIASKSNEKTKTERQGSKQGKNAPATETSQESVLDGLERRIAQSKVSSSIGLMQQQKSELITMTKVENDVMCSTGGDLNRKRDHESDQQHVSDHFQTVQVREMRKANVTTVPEVSKGATTTDYMRNSSGFGETEGIINTMQSVLQSSDKKNASKSLAESRSSINQADYIQQQVNKKKDINSKTQDTGVAKSLISNFNELKSPQPPQTAQIIRSGNLKQQALKAMPKRTPQQIKSNATKIGRVQVHARGETGSKLQQQQNNTSNCKRRIIVNKNSSSNAAAQNQEPPSGEKIEPVHSYQMKPNSPAQLAQKQFLTGRATEESIVNSDTKNQKTLESSLIDYKRPQPVRKFIADEGSSASNRILYSKFVEEGAEPINNSLHCIKRNMAIANGDQSVLSPSDERKQLHNLSMPTISAEGHSSSNQVMMTRRRSEQFQMYIQMNMHNVHSQALKDTYAKQIQAQQIKRSTQIASGGAGSNLGVSSTSNNDRGKTLRTVSSDVSDPVISISDSQRLNSGQKIYAGSPQHQFIQKRRLSSGAHQLKANKVLQQQSNHLQQMNPNSQKKIQQTSGSQGLPSNEPPQLISGLNLIMNKAGHHHVGDLVRAPMNSVNDLKKLDKAGSILKSTDSLTNLQKPKNVKLTAVVGMARQGSFDNRVDSNTTTDGELIKKAQEQLQHESSLLGNGPTRQAVSNIVQQFNGTLPQISRTIDESMSLRQSTASNENQQMRSVYKGDKGIRGSMIVLDSDNGSKDDQMMMQHNSLNSINVNQFVNSGTVVANSTQISPTRSLNPIKSIPRKQGFAENLREKELIQAQQLKKPLFQKNRNKKENGARLKLKSLLHDEQTNLLPSNQSTHQQHLTVSQSQSTNQVGKTCKVVPHTTNNSGIVILPKNSHNFSSSDTGNKLPLLSVADRSSQKLQESDFGMNVSQGPILTGNHHRILTHVQSKKHFPTSSIASHRVSQDSSPTTANQVLMNIRRQQQQHQQQQ